MDKPPIDPQLCHLYVPLALQRTEDHLWRAICALEQIKHYRPYAYTQLMAEVLQLLEQGKCKLSIVIQNAPEF